MERIEIISERLTTIARNSLALIPQLIVTLVILVVTGAIAKLVSFAHYCAMKQSRFRPSLVNVLQKLLAVSILIVGLLVGATVLFPNLTPAKLLAGLGIGSIAIGLAFKDIFENILAGILIHLREAMIDAMSGRAARK